MDGTLIDSGDVIVNTINFVRTNIGLDPMDKQTILTNVNNPQTDPAKFFYGTTIFTDEQTELFNQYYDKNCIKDITLYDGIKDLLEKLSQNFELSIATNASKTFATKMIQYLEIDKYFSMVVGSTCVQNPKPHPDMIKKTLDTLRYSSSDTVLIGDSYKDKYAAQKAGVDCIIVNWGFTDYKDSTKVVTTPNQILNIFTSRANTI